MAWDITVLPWLLDCGLAPQWDEGAGGEAR